MSSLRTHTRRAAALALASTAVASAAVLGASSAQAAPDATTAPAPAPKTTPINVEQTPNIGISIAGIPMPFAAALTAEKVDGTTDATKALTRLALDPAADACGSNLRNSTVGVTVTNKRTGKTTDATFPACVDGKPSAGVDVPTGTGKITFTTSVVGQGNKTFSVVPGSGSFTR